MHLRFASLRKRERGKADYPGRIRGCEGGAAPHPALRALAVLPVEISGFASLGPVDIQHMSAMNVNRP